MKHAWALSRNLISTETIPAELKIRLNSKMKYDDFYSFAQSQPELIKCAKSKQKYSYVKTHTSCSEQRGFVFSEDFLLLFEQLYLENKLYA